MREAGEPAGPWPPHHFSRRCSLLTLVRARTMCCSSWAAGAAPSTVHPASSRAVSRARLYFLAKFAATRPLTAAMMYYKGTIRVMFQHIWQEKQDVELQVPPRRQLSRQRGGVVQPPPGAPCTMCSLASAAQRITTAVQLPDAAAVAGWVSAWRRDQHCMHGARIGRCPTVSGRKRTWRDARLGRSDAAAAMVLPWFCFFAEWRENPPPDCRRQVLNGVTCLRIWPRKRRDGGCDAREVARLAAAGDRARGVEAPGVQVDERLARRNQRQQLGVVPRCGGGSSLAMWWWQ
jgi:hypothetical protein